MTDLQPNWFDEVATRAAQTLANTPLSARPARVRPTCVLDADSMPPQPIGSYDTIVCPIVGCGEGLYLRTLLCTPLLVGTTAAELADPASAVTQEWRVECVAGHVLVLPEYTGQDTCIFGADPEHRDMARLGETISGAKS